MHTYKFEDVDQFALLSDAAELRDTMEVCRKEIERAPFYTDRFGAIKPNPAHKVMHDSKSLFCRLIRELGMSLETEEQTRGRRRY